MGLKLNIGCGLIGLKGFLNTDISTNPLELPTPVEGVEIKGGIDATDNLKFDDNSVDAITTSHFFLVIPEGHYLKTLKEWYRVLVPGGVVRIVDVNFDQPKSVAGIIELYKKRANSYPTRFMMYEYLKKAGFTVHDVNDRTTFYKDKSLIQDFHGDYATEFHIEGIKEADNNGSN